MDNAYLKLFAVFALLAALRLGLYARRVPLPVRQAVSEYADSGIIASVVAIFVVTFLLQISRVEGASMQPTLRTGEYALVNKFTYRWNPPKRGDVIVFRSPEEAGVDYIKRIIALPGETVEVCAGQVYVNGAALKETYEAQPPAYDFPRTVVPPDSLFVLGDNRNLSYDSHQWGFLSENAIRGRASVILWPPSLAGSIPGHPVTGPAPK